MPLKPGDVIKVWDGSIRPPDFKRFVVVCPHDGWLLRINSSTKWKPHWLISAAKNPECLKYDSYLELRGAVDFLVSELDDAQFLGALSDETLEDLIDFLPTVETLSEADCEKMLACLNAAWD